MIYPTGPYREVCLGDEACCQPSKNTAATGPGGAGFRVQQPAFTGVSRGAFEAAGTGALRTLRRPVWDSVEALRPATFPVNVDPGIPGRRKLRSGLLATSGSRAEH